jgi:hypothetical protein
LDLDSSKFDENLISSKKAKIKTVSVQVNRAKIITASTGPIQKSLEIMKNS